MHLDSNTLILLGVFVHLTAALAKALFHTPKQQAQIDAIESKVDGVLRRIVGTPTSTVPTAAATPPAAPTTAPDTKEDAA